MVIRSPFKDYYDYVSNKYGGGDPKIVYSRTRLTDLPKPDKPDLPLVLEIKGGLSLPSLHGWFWRDVIKKYIYLIIAGKPYLLSRSVSAEDSLNNHRLEPLVALKTDLSRSHLRDVGFGKEHPTLVKLSQKIGHPVFAIQSIDGGRHGKIEVTIHSQCPILQNLGIASLIPAEQMYQDLAYFVGNKMKDSPDTRPPLELSNSQKILKAGFDLVKSFRHRK